MKNSLWGAVCACLVLGCGVAMAQAQEVPAPGAENEEPEQALPAPRKTAPPLPKVPILRRPGEQGMWLGVSAWRADPKPVLRRGTSPYDIAGDIPFQGKPSFNQGMDIGIAVGLHNSLKLTYVRARASGMINPGRELVLWNAYYAKGWDLATDYRLTAAKLSFDYLTLPYPVKTSRFRLKTLWQFHYVRMRTGFDAPFIPVTDDDGNRLADENGDPLTFGVEGATSVALPAVGVGLQEYVTDRLRLEGSVAGFAFPHRSNLWDAEGSANIRLGSFDLRLGWREYHVRSSPKKDFWSTAKMSGPFIGIRVHTD